MHRPDARRTTEFSTGDRAALGLYATTEGLRLGWETFARAGTAQYRTVVDAASGQLAISFGSQVRSYTLQPYTLVKDERTEH